MVVAMLATSTTAFADSITVDTSTVIEAKDIFEDWVSYPNPEFGPAYNAGWRYDEEGDYINTTENVGWTGFYNPAIDNLTTGTFAFEMRDDNFDPCGFTWGLTKTGTEEDPSYSFYVYEECDYSNYWCVAYVSEWHPARDGYEHKGPIYHSTVDADDYTYDHGSTEGTDANKVGYAEGEILAYGNLDEFDLSSNNFHKVLIDIKEDTVSVSINDTILAEVEAPVQAGSFGPFATSNPDAYFQKLKMVSTNEVMLNPVFEYRNADGEAVNEAAPGEEITIADLSTFEGSEIVSRTWTVTKDGEVIYTGTEPYTEYTSELGTYVTTLSLLNAYGISSDVYEGTLVVKEMPTEPATEAPTEAPTEVPTEAPTEAPTQVATSAPTQAPTKAPTQAPTQTTTTVSTTSGKTVNTGSSGVIMSVLAVLATASIATVAVTGYRKRKENN